MTDLNEIFVSESNYVTEMKSRVLPYINARRKDGYLDGYDGKSLHYVSYDLSPNDPKPKAAVIISHGFTESAEKWHETAYYLLNDGYNVYIIEHRGHALSYRAVSDKTLTHIDRFDEYVDDFGIFVNLVRSEQNGDLYLLAHSMGCAIRRKKSGRIQENFSLLAHDRSLFGRRAVMDGAIDNARRNTIRKERKTRVHFRRISQ